MKEGDEVLVQNRLVEAKRPATPWFDLPPRLILACLALVVCFSLSLFHWARFALQSDLFSYTLLVPFISAYLFVVSRKKTSTTRVPWPRGTAVLLIGLGLAVLAGFWLAKLSGATLVAQDSVALTTFSFVLLLAGFCASGLNAASFGHAVFPLAFLVFMVPFPVALEHAVEALLQQGSAPPAFWLFQLIGTPVFRQDLVFQLPGISLQIAPECSGIRSTVVLFMTSILAGHLFLRSRWRRAVLAFVVIPLALVRNGFRIFTIGELCVRMGPHMIDSPVHHRGGPIFFALSLVPFFLFLFYLIKTERSALKSHLPVSTR